MLKRYDIWALDYHELAVEEDEDGDWYKREDVDALLREYNMFEELGD